MTDAGLLFKYEHRLSEIFWRMSSGRGSRYDDNETEVLQRRIRDLKKKMVGT